MIIFWTSSSVELAKTSLIVVARGVLIDISVPAPGSDSIDFLLFSFLAFEAKEHFKLSDKRDHFDYISFFR